jgi:zinc-ribbon domain
MSCPKCGLQITSDQRFCRACGASLQLVTQPLAETTSPIIAKRDTSRQSGLSLLGLIIMFVGAAVGIIGKKLIYEDIVTVTGALIALAGIALTVFPYLWSPGQKRVEAAPSSKPDMLDQPQPSKYLPQESGFEYVPSVTERTTTLLAKADSTKPKEEDDAKLQE